MKALTRYLYPLASTGMLLKRCFKSHLTFAGFLTLLAFSPAQEATAAPLSESFDGPALLAWQAVSRTENPSGATWRLVSAIVDESNAHLIDPRGGAAMATIGFEAVASGAAC